MRVYVRNVYSSAREDVKHRSFKSLYNILPAGTMKTSQVDLSIKDRWEFKYHWSSFPAFLEVIVFGPCDVWPVQRHRFPCVSHSGRQFILKAQILISLKM